MADRPTIVLLAWGNPARGDDGAGPSVLARVLAVRDTLPCRLTGVETLQLAPEHAYDLIDADLAVFIDAECSHKRSFTWRPLEARRPAALFSHHQTPEAVLYWFEHMQHRPAPPAWMLGIGARDCTLGAPISAACESHIGRASAWLTECLKAPAALANRVPPGSLQPRGNAYTR